MTDDEIEVNLTAEDILALARGNNVRVPYRAEKYVTLVSPECRGTDTDDE